MAYQVQRFVEKQAKRTIQKYHLAVYKRRRELSKREKRTGKKRALAGLKITRWTLEQQFDPFYVRSKVKSISRALEAAIKAKSYRPRPSLEISIPKETGGKRCISIYSVPDAAIGTWLRERLQARNSNKLSKSAFGYQTDKNANDAIKYIADSVKENPRTFVVEYDFAKFFDSINHDYLVEVLENHFDVRPEEMSVLKALLSGQYATEEGYASRAFKNRAAGIPQGNTISLFLANAVCYELDQELETLGVSFARYADDIVMLSPSYVLACRAANAILKWSLKSKVAINHKKSDGLSLLLLSGVGEIRTKPSITFLGCELSHNGVRPSPKRIARLKKRISKIIYTNLIQAAKKKTFNKKRIKPDVDWDLVVCVNEIRKVLYGRLKQKDIDAGLDGTETLKPVRSQMSGFAMVDDPARFTELDGWIVGALERAYAMRSALVAALGAKPLTLNRRTLIDGSWYKFTDFPNETSLPSSFRAWFYIRKYYRSRGIRALPAPAYDY